ncbi:MAG: UDP-N-acetylmuramoyl-L-alanyl-D-glutamate--2,6-diaminopimelate ligase [Clostridia bacterium]|nr:UDP-N-acetylmuramoyl-L-alanyl-D-glutamate--2,6-diaminopimelate ligase [Clostridia bacterium]
MNLADVLCGTDISVPMEISSLNISGVSSDSRRIVPGEIFVAIDGCHTSGTKYAIEAEDKGAALYIGEKYADSLHIPQLITRNVRRTLAYACANLCGNPQRRMKIIGVTGTNGKTSTAYMLRTVLAHAGYKTALIGTLKSMLFEEEYRPQTDKQSLENFVTMTTPDPELLYPSMKEMADNGAEVLIMETSSHALALEKLAPIEFEIGIFTNISSEHLDFHKNEENYLAAKAKLFLSCKKGLVNADDLRAADIISKAKCKVLTYAIRKKADYHALQIRSNGVFGSEYVIHSRNARFKIKTRIPGDFTLYNTLAAAAAAREIGVDLMQIQNALYTLDGICGRLERVNLGFCDNIFSVFIDYAHTPYALENLLQSVQSFRSAGQRIVTLFGCGGDRDKEKRSKMGAIAVEMSDYVIITSDNSRTEDPGSIISDILSGVGDAKNYIVIENRREAINFAIESALEGDIILLVGKGHEQYEIDKDGVHPFSEREIAVLAASKRE